MTSAPIGYIALVRRNPRFRRLWFGQIVSQLGDWFDSIALFTLLLALTGSGQAVGGLLVAQFLPPALVGPFAGVVIDRVPRKLVMVISDIARALVVPILFLVRSPEDVWIIYVVTALKFSLTSFFEPARSAVLPNIARPEELVAANGLAGATWSAMLAIGAALGGLVVGTLGVNAALALDAVSFLVSALLIAGIPMAAERTQPTRSTAGVPLRAALAAPLHELAEGFRFVFSRAEVFFLTFAKAFWSLGGGVLLLLTLFGSTIFPSGANGALSIGLFYAARGLGAALGPLLAQRWGGETPLFLRRAIGPAFFLTAIGYFWLSGAGMLWMALLAVMLAHMGGSIQWVFSTTLLQMQVPNRLLGRVFAVEFAALTLATACSSYLTGVASDAGFAPRTLAVGLAFVFLATGTIMTVALLRVARPTAAPRPAGHD